MKKLLKECFHKVRDDRGVGAILVLLLLAGIMAAAGFFVSSSRMSQDATRLKQATDAAAQAAVMAWVSDKSVDTLSIAQRYVLSNLGMDTVQLNQNLFVAVEPAQWQGLDGLKVTASFRASPYFLKAKDETVEVSSTAVAIKRPLEVALAVPNTLNESLPDIQALRRLVEGFWDELIEGREDRTLALIPYSGDVNVWDDKKGLERARSWAEPSRLSPPWFDPIRADTGIEDLSSPRLPNSLVKRLDLARGLNKGEAFRWTEAPQKSFEIKVSAAMSGHPENWPDMPYITWRGPRLPPDGNTDIDERTMSGDKTLPAAALLPLTDNKEELRQRLLKMEKGWGMNINIAMGWSAMTLAPAFRGIDGWGSTEHPLDFSDEGGDAKKAIVFITNLAGDLDAVDGDSKNYHFDRSYYGPWDVSDRAMFDRVKRLCSELKEHQILFYFLAVGPNPDSEGTGGRRFLKTTYPAMQTCRNKVSDFKFANGKYIADVESEMSDYLKTVAAELDGQNSVVRLVQ